MSQLTATIKKLQQLTKPIGAVQANHSAIFLSDQGNDSDLILRQLQALLLEGKTHRNPHWAAHMTATISSDSLVAQCISSMHNGNLLSPELYPVLTTIKQQVLDWLCPLFDKSHGHFTAGGSYGNLEALWQAKQRYPQRNKVFASQTAHYSIEKACQILGLDLDYIASDSDDKIVLSQLKKACDRTQPLAIVATAGTAAAGIFDPLDNCIEIATEVDAWIHIDAAWGGHLKLLPEHDGLFGQHLAQADSLSFDPHKAWSQPKPASILLYNQATVPMVSIEADYLHQPPDNILPGSQGGEAFLPLWLNVATSGMNALRENSRYALAQAQLFATLLAEQSNWTLHTSPSGIVCFETAKKLDDLIHQGVLSTAKKNHRAVYRAVFIGNHVMADAIIAKLQPYF